MIKYANEIIKEIENMEKYKDKDKYICGEEFEEWLRMEHHKGNKTYDRTRI